jgi:Ca-activated chloride channel family protein
VLVDVGVHDDHGRAVGILKQGDFHVFEDGKEQEICAFSHEELPLAVALVVDNSSSIAAALEELRAGALDTLALLKPADQVAIFSFGEKPEMEEGLTSDHEALSVDLWALSPYGGTALNDALYEAALYLGRAARQRRRAVILVSDNEPSDEETRDVPQVVRAAQQSGTPIYSVKVGFLQHSRTFFLTHPEPRLHDVEKICRQTGGEMIDTRSGISVTSAMQAIITWLKQGYTLGYSPSNKRLDGTYRTIEVRLNGRSDPRMHKYTIYARQGYYAPTTP